MEKKVFVSFLKHPISTAFHLEGIRVAMGILSGDEEHEVTIAYLGKGVRCARKGVDTSYTKGMLDNLKKSVSGGAFYVERESLQDERIPESEIGEMFKVVPRKSILEMMNEADVTLSF